MTLQHFGGSAAQFPAWAGLEWLCQEVSGCGAERIGNKSVMSRTSVSGELQCPRPSWTGLGAACSVKGVPSSARGWDTMIFKVLSHHSLTPGCSQGTQRCEWVLSEHSLSFLLLLGLAGSSRGRNRAGMCWSCWCSVAPLGCSSNSSGIAVGVTRSMQALLVGGRHWGCHSCSLCDPKSQVGSLPAACCHPGLAPASPGSPELRAAEQ